MISSKQMQKENEKDEIQYKNSQQTTATSASVVPIAVCCHSRDRGSGTLAALHSTVGDQGEFPKLLPALRCLADAKLFLREKTDE